MKKIIKLTIILLTILTVSGCQKNYMQEISYQEYKQLLKEKETFILEIMRTECSACIDFKPKIEQVVKDYQIEIKYINTDHLSEDEYQSLYQETGITGTPTVIFYHDGNEETVASRIKGSVSVDKIISKFKTNGFIKTEEKD